MSTLVLGKDANGAVSFALPLSGNVYSTTLASEVAQSLTVPMGYTSVIFSFGNGVDVWVEFKDATDATLPSGGFVQGTKELNPVARTGLTPGQTISFISPTSAYVEAYFTA